MVFIFFMKISTINIPNKYYNNFPTQKTVLSSSKVSDSFAFTGSYDRLGRDTIDVVSSISNAYKEINLTEPKKVTKNEENVKLKPKVISKTKEYKQLMKECNEKLTQAMKNAESDMQGFNKTLQEIQSKIVGFFTKTEE